MNIQPNQGKDNVNIDSCNVKFYADGQIRFELSLRNNDGSICTDDIDTYTEDDLITEDSILPKEESSNES